jgi:hypothetical protein
LAEVHGRWLTGEFLAVVAEDPTEDHLPSTPAKITRANHLISTPATTSRANHLLSTLAKTYTADRQLQPRPTHTSTEDFFHKLQPRWWPVEVLAEVHGRWLTGEVLAVVAEDPTEESEKTTFRQLQPRSQEPTTFCQLQP